MQKQIGLWIDHKKAVIVSLENPGEKIQQIDSNMEKHVRFKGGSRGKTAYSAQYLSEETREDRRYHEQLNKFYRQVISVVGEADSLLVFGAGEAKLEFEKCLKHEKSHFKEIRVESADKMTERQIAAKVRGYFEK